MAAGRDSSGGALTGYNWEMRTDSELLGKIAAEEARVRAGAGSQSPGVVDDVLAPGVKGFVAGRVGK